MEASLGVIVIDTNLNPDLSLLALLDVITCYLPVSTYVLHAWVSIVLHVMSLLFCQFLAHAAERVKAEAEPWPPNPALRANGGHKIQL